MNIDYLPVNWYRAKIGDLNRMTLVLNASTSKLSSVTIYVLIHSDLTACVSR